MSVEAASEQSEVSESSPPQFIPRSRWSRILYGLFLLVMPGVAFWATDFFKPEWQDGHFDSYLILLLSPGASWPFFPLLLYSVLSYLLLLNDFELYSRRFVVRFGIYTGVLLALQYSVLSGLYFFNAEPSFLMVLLIWILPILVSGVYAWSVRRWGAQKVLVAIVALSLIVYVVLAMISKMLSTPPLLLLMVLTIGAPFWCFLLFLQASIWLVKNSETRITLPRGLGLAGWFGAYILAWRVSILKMYELYAALPPQPPPNCYIATAAAQGHPQFVGSRVVFRTDGMSLKVNRQLQILKCAELAMMAVQPRLHKMLRNLYDIIGKFLARRIENRYLADVAYLLLKPWEWLALFCLKLVISEVENISSKIYVW